jgi:hypothetical protein
MPCYARSCATARRQLTGGPARRRHHPRRASNDPGSAAHVAGSCPASRCRVLGRLETTSLLWYPPIKAVRVRARGRPRKDTPLQPGKRESQIGGQTSLRHFEENCQRIRINGALVGV